MKFSRPEYWSGQPFPSPGDLPNPGIEAGSPTLQADPLPSESSQKPKALPKARRAKLPKNGLGHCLAVCCPSGPLELSESWRNITSEKYAQQINEMH